MEKSMRRSLAGTLFLLLFATFCVVAADNDKAFTDPRAAGPDFAIQGEYLGTIDADGNRWGAHVIALGKGKFDVVGYLGGLPGDGWHRGDRVNRVPGELKDGVAEFVSDEYMLKVHDGQMEVLSADGDPLGKLKKVERKSPTLGAKPPAGAIVLFDGASTEDWENGRIVEDNLLAASNAQSKKIFGDHSLHIEFSTPFMPEARGQGRGNSGVYVQGRYEVQVLDSFGLEGKDNECGGIYSISEPKLNMCYPPLAWQTYDIDFQAARYDDSGKKTQNARVTVRHNGTVIHDNIEIAHGTPGRYREGPEKQGLFLQDHGNPVVFRNIWVVEK
jgi:hypothetical protein